MSLFWLFSLHSARSYLNVSFYVGVSSVCQLLDFEARSGEQVPLLLKMKRSQLALSKAVESGDTDLGECDSPAHHLSIRLMMSHWWFPMFSVYTVVTYLKNEMNRGDFFMTLRNQPVALSLYRQVLIIIILIWLINYFIVGMQDIYQADKLLDRSEIWNLTDRLIHLWFNDLWTVNLWFNDLWIICVLSVL